MAPSEPGVEAASESESESGARGDPRRPRGRHAAALSDHKEPRDRQQVGVAEVVEQAVNDLLSHANYAHFDHGARAMLRKVATGAVPTALTIVQLWPSRQQEPARAFLQSVAASDVELPRCEALAGPPFVSAAPAPAAPVAPAAPAACAAPVALAAPTDREPVDMSMASQEAATKFRQLTLVQSWPSRQQEPARAFLQSVAASDVELPRCEALAGPPFVSAAPAPAAPAAPAARAAPVAPVALAAPEELALLQYPPPFAPRVPVGARVLLHEFGPGVVVADDGFTYTVRVDWGATVSVSSWRVADRLGCLLLAVALHKPGAALSLVRAGAGEAHGLSLAVSLAKLRGHTDMVEPLTTAAGAARTARELAVRLAAEQGRTLEMLALLQAQVEPSEGEWGKSEAPLVEVAARAALAAAHRGAAPALEELLRWRGPQLDAEAPLGLLVAALARDEDDALKALLKTQAVRTYLARQAGALDRVLRLAMDKQRRAAVLLLIEAADVRFGRKDALVTLASHMVHDGRPKRRTQEDSFALDLVKDVLRIKGSYAARHLPGFATAMAAVASPEMLLIVIDSDVAVPLDAFESVAERCYNADEEMLVWDSPKALHVEKHASYKRFLVALLKGSVSTQTIKALLHATVLEEGPFRLDMMSALNDSVLTVLLADPRLPLFQKAIEQLAEDIWGQVGEQPMPFEDFCTWGVWTRA
jgi:hypothetical protein